MMASFVSAQTDGNALARTLRDERDVRFDDGEPVAVHLEFLPRLTGLGRIWQGILVISVSCSVFDDSVRVSPGELSGDLSISAAL